MDFHAQNIQEAAYKLTAAGTGWHRILAFGYPMPQER